MGARGLLTADEQQRVVEAIRAAESGTSGEIRVHIERHCKGDPLERARALFAEMGMTATKRRNGVLLYIASADHRFAIFGDQGIDREVGAAFWDAIRDRLAERFGAGAFCEGIGEAVGRVGETLKASFPREADDVNELADDTSFGE